MLFLAINSIYNHRKPTSIVPFKVTQMFLLLFVFFLGSRRRPRRRSLSREYHRAARRLARLLDDTNGVLNVSAADLTNFTDPFAPSDVEQFISKMEAPPPAHMDNDTVIDAQIALKRAQETADAAAKAGLPLEVQAAAQLEARALKDQMKSAKSAYDRRMVSDQQATKTKQKKMLGHLEAIEIHLMKNATAANATSDVNEDDYEKELQKREIKRLEKKLSDKRQEAVLEKLVQQQKKQIRKQKEQARAAEEARREAREREMRRDFQEVQKQIQEQALAQQKEERLKRQIEAMRPVEETEEPDESELRKRLVELERELVKQREEQLEKLKQAKERAERMLIPPTPSPTATPPPTTAEPEETEFVWPSTPTRSPTKAAQPTPLPTATIRENVFGFIPTPSQSRRPTPSRSPTRSRWPWPTPTRSSPKSAPPTTEVVTESDTFEPTRPFTASSEFTSSNTFEPTDTFAWTEPESTDTFTPSPPPTPTPTATPAPTPTPTTERTWNPLKGRKIKKLDRF